MPTYSFDQPRERSAPSSFILRSLDGALVSRSFDQLTLVVAIKSTCDGCRDFVHSTLSELRNVTVIIISATGDGDGEWHDAVQPVFVAPALWTALDIRAAPFYVLVDPTGPRVIGEGFVFDPVQVAQEIAPLLAG